MNTKSEPLLWLDSARGQYIPRDFALCFRDRDSVTSCVSLGDWKILEKGPESDNPYYWDAWDHALNYCIVTIDGIPHTLWQDGDLWLIPNGMAWDEDSDFFIWPSDSDDSSEGVAP